MKHFLDRTDRLAALRIIAIYALFAALWIYFSDNALGMLVHDTSILVRISVFKGFLFIVVTAALLYQLIARYIQKSREIEEKLRVSQNLMNALVEGTTDTIFVKDRQGRYLLFNSAAANVVGKSAAEVIGHDDTALFSAGEAGAIMADDRRVMEAGRVMTYEDYLTSADGIHRTFLSTKGPILDAAGGIIGIFGISHDITERKRAQEELQEVTQRLQLAAASGHLGIWDWDIINNLVIWNDRMYELYGVSREKFRMSQEAWEKRLHPDDRAMVITETTAALSGEKEYDFEFRVVQQDGTVKFIKTNAMVIRDVDGKAFRLIGMTQDITEHRQMEEQLRQSQKMEAIGQLAGGVAHDFNNILTAIYGYCSLLQMKMGKDAPFRAEIDHIYASAERAANLTRSLLAFSRKQIISPKPVNLNEIVMNVGKLLSRIIGEDIQLKTVSTGNPLRIYADSGQIEQVLMNLAANARDAMPNGGLLTIETEVKEIDERFIHAHGFGAAGKYVVMSVADTGKGMDAETEKKIFEPFFTTKEVGKGTGLGLSIVYGVIKQHNGYINVCSEPDKGTVFRIYIPQICEEETDKEEETVPDYPRMGSETVLLAEDDASIRELMESVLRQFGYDVILARDGTDAVEKFKADNEKIAVIVMDIIMPGKSGREAYEEIRKIRPDIKILFISGYSPDLLQNRGIFDNGEDVLIKPIHPLDLVRKVRAVLDSQAQINNGDAQ
ncbi:MAG TPA: PAS domain-containing protein [Geobacteraceae bacterium]|nr:PAS domain-containing protein [Geobacteraceae bacterium]